MRSEKKCESIYPIYRDWGTIEAAAFNAVKVYYCAFLEKRKK